MKRLSIAFILALFIPLLFFTSGCKKTKTPQVYFSSSSANVNAGGTATVTIALSQPSDNVVEVGFQSIGTSKINFGTTATTFMHDDSDKMQAMIDANGYIDSMGHIQIMPGASGVVISFVQKGDDYAHAAASFEIKMISAHNATIRQGSDTYTYNIGSSSITDQFASSIIYSDTAGSINGGYLLSGYTYTPSGNNYTLTLNYSPMTNVVGPTSLTVTYTNIPPFALGNDTLNCSNTNILVIINKASGPDSLTCNSLTPANTISPLSNTIIPLINTPTPGIYGNYYVFNGSMNIKTSNYGLTGTLSSPFIYYIQ